MTVQKYFQSRAKHLVDLLFDAGLFKEGVSRDDMQSVEDVIAYEYQSSDDSAKRLSDFLARLKNKKEE